MNRRRHQLVTTRKACCAVLQSWVSRKFMTGCFVLFPVTVTLFVARWLIQFIDGLFSPLFARMGVDIFGLGFLTSLLSLFFVGIFVSSWLGATLFELGEGFIKENALCKVHLLGIYVNWHCHFSRSKHHNFQRGCNYSPSTCW